MWNFDGAQSAAPDLSALRDLLQSEFGGDVSILAMSSVDRVRRTATVLLALDAGRVYLYSQTVGYIKDGQFALGSMSFEGTGAAFEPGYACATGTATPGQVIGIELTRNGRTILKGKVPATSDGWFAWGGSFSRRLWGGHLEVRLHPLT